MKSSGILVLVASLSILPVSAAFADQVTLTFQDGDGGAYSSTAGATVTTISDTGDGSGTTLSASSVIDFPVTFSYVRFPDVIGMNPGQIPPGSTVQFASLTLYRVNSSTYTAGLRRVSSEWEENTVSGSDYPAAGGAQSSIPAGDVGPHEANITSVVQEWVDGTENWGFEISPAYSYTSVTETFYSDDADVVTTRPLLTVTFTPPTLNAVEATTWGRVKALYR